MPLNFDTIDYERGANETFGAWARRIKQAKSALPGNEGEYTNEKCAVRIRAAGMKMKDNSDLSKIEQHPYRGDSEKGRPSALMLDKVRVGLDLSVDIVMRAAGYWPEQLSVPTTSAWDSETDRMFNTLPADFQATLKEMVRVRYRQLPSAPADTPT